MDQRAKRSKLTRRVMTLLRREMKAAGRGTMARIQEALELRPTFFSEPLDRIELAVVLQVLEALDIAPATFFAALEQTDDLPMPEIPEGCEDIAQYYLAGKHIDEVGDV